ncbi:MAG TPA: hypothetical protein VGP63_19210 [Planctomycetaceae bacterium]|jgi:hypothetical protein|nr:hypothetical protein [Planctomycetaceae bacterium]
MSIPEKRLATSDDVPRAVEYLIQLVLRGILWVMSFGFGVGALVCFLERWPLYVAIPLAVASVLTAVGGWAIKSSPGRLVIGTSTRDIGIVVPRSNRDADSSSPDRT